MYGFFQILALRLPLSRGQAWPAPPSRVRAGGGVLQGPADGGNEPEHGKYSPWFTNNMFLF